MELREQTFKVLGDNRQSHHGGSGTWCKGQWRTVEGKLRPCSNGIHYCKPEHLVLWLGPTIWLFEDGTPDETIDNGNKMVTRKGRILGKLETWNETTARLFATDCAETVVEFIPGNHREPFVAAINAARGFARGEISYEQRAAARDAAWDSAGDATWDAARYAARAAARAAAGAAARDAAWDSARYAARDSAWAATQDAAGAAARAAQTVLLFEYLSGERA